MVVIVVQKLWKMALVALQGHSVVMEIVMKMKIVHVTTVKNVAVQILEC